MASRGRGADSGRGRASASLRGGPGWRGSFDASRGRGGAIPLNQPSFRGGDRGGRGSVSRGSGPPLRGCPRTSVFMHGQEANIDPRIADNSDRALVASFNSAGTARGPDSLPHRPDFGTDGREIKLRANFFPVQVLQDTKLYAYDVAIMPAAMHRMKRRIYDLAEQTTAWIQAGMNLPGRVVHNDNARLISSHPLPQPLTIRVPYYDEEERGPQQQGGRTYTLMISFVEEIDTGQLTSYLAGQIRYRDYNASPAITALNIILTSLPRKTSIVVGRNRYFSRPVAEPFELGGGVEAWKGLYTSVRPVHKQLTINANVCTSAFYTPGNLMLAMKALQDASLDARMDIFFRRVRIEGTHLGYRKIANGLVSQTARTHSFDAPEYGHVTVEDYFRRKYNIRLQYPDLQLIRVGGPTEDCLPVELCDIVPGQPFRRALIDQRALIMSTKASQSPSVNGETIVSQVHHQLGLDVIRPELQSFGITIGPDMVVVPGRILPRPGITYAPSAAASISSRASWNLVGVKFAVGARLDNWAVLVIKDGVRAEFTSDSDRDLHNIVSDFRHMCNASGMHVTADPTYATVQLPRNGLIRDLMRQEAIETIKDTLLSVNPKPILVLVILANGDGAIYEGVKRLCDVHLDVATVCIQSSKFRKRDPHYLANVALKVNTKLGGVNHRLDANYAEWLDGTSTMVVGMDVNHPSPGSAVGCPSIVAVVASVDNDFAQYPVILGIQDSRREMITDLRNMMIDRLKLFQRKNDEKLPERILIYRSGISRNQFNHVREVERPLILEAFRAFGSYRPRFTIVICSKSRHVRFYPTEQDNAASDGNPLPGTVVDRGVTAIYDFDFFLQSHGVVRGTARPTHYCVIHDDIGFKANEIQGVTNALSYAFARATQAVSIVPPAYYANIACRRGRCYLRKLFYGSFDEDATVVEGWSEGVAERDDMREARRLWGWGVAGAGLKDTMFYL